MRLVSTALESQCAFCMHADNLHEMRTAPCAKRWTPCDLFGNESLDRPCVFALCAGRACAKGAAKAKTDAQKGERNDDHLAPAANT
jgi:hypothetical protein